MTSGAWRTGMWRRGLLCAGLAVAVATLLALHRFVPNTVGNLGSLVETFLPWLGWTLPPLTLWALLRRSASAAVALAMPLILWLSMFAGLLPDKYQGDGHLRVLTHNVDADNLDVEGTASILSTADADIVALEELNTSGQAAYRTSLADAYPFHVVHGTVGLWSKHPIVDSTAVDIEIGWTRAMRALVDAPEGRIAVFVAHLASVRVGTDGFTSSQRDSTAQALGSAIAAEESERVVLLGDLNGTAQDRSLAPITYQLESTQALAGAGFGFSWPAGFPMARIDHILVRGVTATSSWQLERTGSDHLPVAADLRY